MESLGRFETRLSRIQYISIILQFYCGWLRDGWPCCEQSCVFVYFPSHSEPEMCMFVVIYSYMIYSVCVQRETFLIVQRFVSLCINSLQGAVTVQLTAREGSLKQWQLEIKPFGSFTIRPVTS